MKPPFFVWKADVLDVFDSVQEIEDRYEEREDWTDAVMYDSLGHELLVIQIGGKAARCS